MKSKSNQDCPQCDEKLVIETLDSNNLYLICEECNQKYKLIKSQRDPAFPDESKLVKRNKRGGK